MKKNKITDIFDLYFLNINDILVEDIQILPFFLLKNELFFEDDFFKIWTLSDYHNVYLIKTPDDYDTVRKQLKHYFNNNIDIYRITSKANIFSDLKTIYITDTPYLSTILEDLYYIDKEKFHYITETISDNIIKYQNKENYNSKNIEFLFNTFNKVRNYFIKDKFSYSKIDFNLNDFLNIEDFNQFRILSDSIKNTNNRKTKRFNDSDFEFFTIENDLFLMDYSSADFYMVKFEDNKFKVYFKSRDNIKLPYQDDINFDAINDLFFNNKQLFFIYKEQLNEANLIAEFNKESVLFLTPKFSNLILIIDSILKNIKKG